MRRGKHFESTIDRNTSKAAAAEHANSRSASSVSTFETKKTNRNRRDIPIPSRAWRRNYRQNYFLLGAISSLPRFTDIFDLTTITLTLTASSTAHSVGLLPF